LGLHIILDVLPTMGIDRIKIGKENTYSISLPFFGLSWLC